MKFQKEILLPLIFLCFGLTTAAAQDCSRTDFHVTTTDEGRSDETTCSTEACTLRGAVFAAVETSYVCATPDVTRQIILQPGAEYELINPQSIGRHRWMFNTAFASLHKGVYKIVGNGATISRDAITNDHKLRFFDIRPDARVTIENLTLRGGRAHAQVDPSATGFSRFNGHGGAIFNNGRLILNNVTLEQNVASQSGGSRDILTSSGGGIFNFGNLSIFSSHIMDDIFSAGQSMLVVDTTFDEDAGQQTRIHIGGRSPRRGGAFPAVTTFRNSSFKDTRFFVQGDIQIIDSEFRDSGTTGVNSPALITYSGSLPTTHPVGNRDVIKPWTAEDVEIRIENSLFANNRLSDSLIALPVSRAISELKRSVVMVNTTIANNQSDTPLLNCGSNSNKITLSSVTMANNSNSIAGSPRNLSVTNGCSVRLSNTVLQSSTAPACVFDGAEISGELSSNFSSDSSCQILNTGNPQLGALADYGGETETMLPLSGSPLIDAGIYSVGFTQGAIYTNSRCEQDESYRLQAEQIGEPCVTYKDQRGVDRLAGRQIDIGAVEVQDFESVSGAMAISLKSQPKAKSLIPVKTDIIKKKAFENWTK